jgi:pimeloyl-ACP methyl ester carboxylesterase
MDPVPTQYIDRDGAALAYQVIGDGPVDVVHAFEILQHLDLQWTDPDIHHNYERGAAFSRVAFFQRRGFGLSDQLLYNPTIEQQADDVLAIMDAVGMRHATLVGNFGTCGAVALAAARAPERVKALVLVEPIAQGLESSDVLHGWTQDDVRTVLEAYRHMVANWGAGDFLELVAPGLMTSYNRRLVALLERCSATPAAAKSYFEWTLRIDIQEVLRSVQAPVRVLKFPTGLVPEAAVRYVAELLPNATFHFLPEAPPGSSGGQLYRPVVDHIEEVATGIGHTPQATDTSAPCCSPTSSPPPSSSPESGTRRIDRCVKTTNGSSDWLSTTTVVR